MKYLCLVKKSFLDSFCNRIDCYLLSQWNLSSFNNLLISRHYYVFGWTLSAIFLASRQMRRLNINLSVLKYFIKLSTVTPWLGTLCDICVLNRNNADYWSIMSVADWMFSMSKQLQLNYSFLFIKTALAYMYITMRFLFICLL